MENKELMDLLKESAEEVEVPNSLKPDAILAKLEEQGSSKQIEKEEIPETKESRKRIPFYKYGSWAAVAVIAMIGIGTAGPAFRKTIIKDEPTEKAEYVEMEEVPEVLEVPEVAAAVPAVSSQMEPVAEMEESVEMDMETFDEVQAEEAETVMAEEVEEQEAETVIVAEEAEVEAETAEEVVDQTVKTVTLHAASYAEIYQLLKEYQENYRNYIVYDDVEYEMAEDMASEAKPVTQSIAAVAKGAVEESAVEDIAVDADAGDFSTTNVRENGIEEADLVKTDGSYIYAMDSKGNIRIIDAKKEAVVGEIPSDQENRNHAEMYIEGNQLQIIQTGEIYESLRSTKDGARSTYTQMKPQTSVYTYDITDREAPVLTDIYTQDGGYLTSRRKDGCLYLFTSFYPYYEAEEDLEEGYIPKTGDTLLPCEKFYYLPCDGEERKYDGSGYLVAGSISDEAPSDAKDQICIMNGTGMFYVSQKNIYTASSSWNHNQNSTELFRFGYEDGMFLEGCSAKIPGRIENSFCMDEYNDMLRVVVTVEGYWPDFGIFTRGSTFYRNNRLYVMDQNLEIVGKIRGIARNEEIKSARFMGDTGYFVTYENTDPLFSVDLKDPQNPVLLGELSVTGFSEYLHPYGENLLLGIGWETDPETGTFEGLKCSMFDTTDQSDVKEIDRLVITDADFSIAMEDYKAILINPEKNLFGFAYGGYGPSYASRYFYGTFTYDKEAGFTQLAYLPIPGQEENEWNAWEGYRNSRGIYIGEKFYLANDYGIFVYDMNQGFAETGKITW